MKHTPIFFEALNAIQGEFNYQDSRWNEDTTPTEGVHSVTEWIAYMEDYLLEAKHQVARGADPAASNLALNTIRKVTAMGMRCMQENGIRKRKGFEEVNADILK